MKFFLCQDLIRKNFDAINVLNKIKEKNLKVKLGIAYNPYLQKYYKDTSERERFQGNFLQD